MEKLVAFAKQLRANATDTERLLWSRLRAGRLEELKFRRQEPIGQYIVDFICYEQRLVIECDGGQHMVQQEKDRIRDAWLEQQGYRILRFWNNDILKHMELVLETILEACQRGQQPPPSNSLPQGEGGKTMKKRRASPSPSPPPLKGGGKE